MGVDGMVAQGEGEGLGWGEDGWDGVGFFAVDLDAGGLKGVEGDGFSGGAAGCFAFGEEGEVAESGGDGGSAGDVGDVEGVVVPAGVGAWVEVAAVVWHVGDDEDAGL